MWRAQRTRRLLLWISMSCVIALLIQVQRMLHYLTDSADFAYWMMRADVECTLLLLPLIVAICRGLTGIDRPPQMVPIVFGVVAILALATSLFVSPDMYVYRDGLGQTLLWAKPGPLMWLVPVSLLSVLAYCVAVVIRSKNLDRTSRLVLATAIGCCLCFGVNDFIASQTMTAVSTFEYGFLVLSIAFHFVNLRSGQRVHLEHEDVGPIAEQTGLPLGRLEVRAA